MDLNVYAAEVRHLHRASLTTLARCPGPLRKAYTSHWNELYALTVQVTALSIQSLMRGSMARKQHRVGPASFRPPPLPSINQ